MRKLRLLSLCSGIGGIDIAAHWTGVIEIVGQLEVNPFRRAVLAKHFPDVPRMNDITKMRGDEFGPVDIVAGGIPCQPFSHAGKRHGTADDRHLWPFAFTIIQNVHPAWVLIENVAGFIDLALDLVTTDLESEKYEVQAYVLPACAVGAPHQRARCFVVAYSNSVGNLRQKSLLTNGQRGTVESAGICLREDRAADVAYPTSQGLPLRGCARLIANNTQAGAGMESQLERCSQGVGQADTYGTGLEIRYGSTAERRTCTAFDRHGTGATQPSICRGHDGLSARLDSHRWPALPGQAQEDWEPSRTIKEKIPYRNQRLAALGDAVVPQQIYPLFSAIAILEGRIPA